MSAATLDRARRRRRLGAAARRARRRSAVPRAPAHCSRGTSVGSWSTCTTTPAGSGPPSTWPGTATGPGSTGTSTTRCPAPIAELRAMFYPHLLPDRPRVGVRDSGRPAPWPDTLDEWLAMCHAAGQRRPTPLLLRYGTGRLERAAPRPLRRAGVPAAGGDRARPSPASTTRAASSSSSSNGPRPVPRHRHRAAAGARVRVHHQRPAGAVGARLVGRADAARGEHGAQRHPAHTRSGPARCGVTRRCTR